MALGKTGAWLVVRAGPTSCPLEVAETAFFAFRRSVLLGGLAAHVGEARGPAATSGVSKALQLKTPGFSPPRRRDSPSRPRLP